MAEALDRSNCGVARPRGKEAAVKPVSRRTEMPFQADGAGKLAPHSNARCPPPEVNGAVAQAEFVSLLREICSPSPATGSGAASSNGRRAGVEVSRGRIPRATSRFPPDGLTTREGLNLIGSIDPGWTGVGVDAAWLSRPRASGAETECCEVLRDGQEPPDADPHVRWCGSRGEQSLRRPDWPLQNSSLPA